MPTCKSSASPEYTGGKRLIVIKNSALTLKLLKPVKYTLMININCTW